jgi:hypothetical protein
MKVELKTDYSTADPDGVAIMAARGLQESKKTINI